VISGEVERKVVSRDHLLFSSTNESEAKVFLNSFAL
jgi:hypothetical protein